jgi:hypothetical protein
VLLAAGQGSVPSACCFVYPRSTSVALAAAVVGALSRLRDAFPGLLEAYARRGFELGQRVRVLPKGHVYLFDGVFDERPFFRLRVIDSRRKRWDRTLVSENTVRALPVEEILRLQPTDRTTPLGKQNTLLGKWEDSALDRLLNIQSGSNTSLFRNEVLLLAPRGEVGRAVRTVGISRLGNIIQSLTDAVTWGSIEEDGSVRADDRMRSGEEALVAVTHSVELLAEACERARPCSKLVIIDGVTAPSRNLQAYDRIRACQRVVIVADHNDIENLPDLAARECAIWCMSPGEVIQGAKSEVVDSSEAVRERQSFFGDVRRGAANAARLRITTIPVIDSRFDAISTALINADKALGTELDDAIRKPLGMAFNALLEISSWVVRPSAAEVQRIGDRIQLIESEMRQQVTWMPPGTAAGLGEALVGLRAAL